MTCETRFRPFRPEDFHELAELTCSLWYSEGSLEERFSAAAADLSSYLSQATYRVVAERDGSLVGATLAQEPEAVPADADEWISAERSYRRRLGGRLMDGGVTLAEERLSEDFGSKAGPESGAVIKLLVVNPSAQGLGLGGRLFEDVRTRLREAGATGYYLLTDDDCDVSFYEHKGLERSVTKPLGRIGETESFNIYVYSERF